MSSQEPLVALDINRQRADKDYATLVPNVWLTAKNFGAERAYVNGNEPLSYLAYEI